MGSSDFVTRLSKIKVIQKSPFIRPNKKTFTICQNTLSYWSTITFNPTMRPLAQLTPGHTGIRLLRNTHFWNSRHLYSITDLFVGIHPRKNDPNSFNRVDLWPPGPFHFLPEWSKRGILPTIVDNNYWLHRA